MGRLQGKVAFVTGSTRSIGLAIARAFIAEGAQVILSGTKPLSEGSAIAQSIRAVNYIQLNVAIEEEWIWAMSLLSKQFGRLDILVNNAGIDKMTDSDAAQDPENCSLRDWQKIHAVNLEGTFLGCKIAMPLLRHSEQASIINMGSRSGLVGIPSVSAYASSKAGVAHHTKSVAMYCAQQGYNIRCNVIIPAGILTDMWTPTFGSDDKRDERIAEYANTIPAKRMGTAQDVANCAVYLASNESSFMNGASFLIDGGIMAGAGAYSAPRFFTDHSHVAKNLEVTANKQAKL